MTGSAVLIVRRDELERRPTATANQELVDRIIIHLISDSLVGKSRRVFPKERGLADELGK